MVNKSKATGTSAESAVVKYLRANGFPQAERRALHGNLDLGDITGIPGVVIEIKAGAAAENASDAQVEAWLEETETEKLNAHADIGFLVMKRKAKGAANVGSWWAVVRAPLVLGGPRVTQRFLLEEFVRHLRFSGHGDPL